MATRCAGLTLKGVQCKRVVKNGDYCCYHGSQNTDVVLAPKNDSVVSGRNDDKIYERVYGWPTMADVRTELNHRISWMPERKDLTEYLIHHCKLTFGPAVDEIGRLNPRPVYDKPFLFLLYSETLLRYRKEYFNMCAYMNEINWRMYSMGYAIQAPKKYLEYVRDKTDIVTHIKARRLIVTFILGHTVLCPDCIRNIVRFI